MASAVWILALVGVSALTGAFCFMSTLYLTSLRGSSIIVFMRAKKMPDDIRAYFAKMGSRGGKLGGKIRAVKLTAERRAEIAKKASAARWAKRDESVHARPV